MATSQYGDLSTVPVNRPPYFWSWAGIFAGTFMYIVIETTFGLLGAGIWGSASPGGGAVPTTPLTQTGFQVWMIFVTFIALYFAGKTASKLLYGNADRNLGMYHGLVTFGMCIFTTILVVGFATAGVAAATTAHAGPPTTMASVAGEWWLFVTFICSMITAAIGGMHGVRNRDAAIADRTVATSRRVA